MKTKYLKLFLKVILLVVVLPFTLMLYIAIMPPLILEFLGEGGVHFFVPLTLTGLFWGLYIGFEIKRKLLYCGLCSLPLVICAILSIGNPQRSRYIFQYQLEIENTGSQILLPLKHPEGYTGEWIEWYPFPSNQIRAKHNLVDGVLHGRSTYYSKDGSTSSTQIHDKITNCTLDFFISCKCGFNNID